MRVCVCVCVQIAEGILPHRSALGFPGLAGGFTFTIYGGSSDISLSKFLGTIIFVSLLFLKPSRHVRSGDKAEGSESENIVLFEVSSD